MTSIIVVFPKAENAGQVQRLLTRNGYHVAAVCTSGMTALTMADQLGDGIVITGYRYHDMIYRELRENLPDSFRMILLASDRYLQEDIPPGVMPVSMPLQVQRLLDVLEEQTEELAQEKQRRKRQRRERSSGEKEQIAQAKALLMEKNHISEEEAHRYLQKISMDSGTNMTETAQMLLALMNN